MSKDRSLLEFGSVLWAGGGGGGGGGRGKDKDKGGDKKKDGDKGRRFWERESKFDKLDPKLPPGSSIRG